MAKNWVQCFPSETSEKNWKKKVGPLEVIRQMKAEGFSYKKNDHKCVSLVFEKDVRVIILDIPNSVKWVLSKCDLSYSLEIICIRKR